MEKPIISVSKLSRTFRQYKKEPGLKGSLVSLFKRDYFDISAVNNISFEIEEGEMVGFIGPNGAGKTTTLKMLAGLLYPSSGSIRVMEYTPYQRKNDFLKKYSLVMGQKSQLWWDLPPMEGFLLNKEIYEVNDKIFNESIEELASLLDVVGVLKVPVRKLSLGQRMKCELIAALLHRPKILFLDEPTIGLDVVVQKNIRAFLKEYNLKFKTTVMLTSHYMEDVQELCQRVIIIDRGGIIYDGGLKDLIAKYAKKKNLKLVFNETVKRKSLTMFGEITHYGLNGLSATISVDRKDHTQIASALLSKLPVDDLDISEISLDDVIRQIFSDSNLPTKTI